MKQFLEELYEQEPELRKNEEQINKIVSQMITLKPQVSTPENFKKILKNRLASEMVILSEQKSQKRNKYFRFFWYVFGTGVLASFTVSFGFLSIFGITDMRNLLGNPQNKAPSTFETNSTLADVRTMETNKESLDAPVEAGVQDTPNIAMFKTVTPQETLPIATKKLITPESRTEPTGALATTDTPSDAPVAMSLMMTPEQADAPLSKQNMNIAYVGQDMTTEISASKSAPTPESDAMFGAEVTDKQSPPPEDVSITTTGSSLSGSEDTSIGASGSIAKKTHKTPDLTFGELISRAQTEAYKIIEEKDRFLYVLDTPQITYISENSTSEKDTTIMKKVYIFPLIRTDGKDSLVHEVRVVIPE